MFPARPLGRRTGGEARMVAMSASVLGVSLRYLGEQVAGSDEKGERSRKKRFLGCSAILCERADALKALGGVAGYLENGVF
jgi:hypothetical protein